VTGASAAHALTTASLALGPSPEIGFVLQCVGLFATLGAIAAARSFRRTGDADRRWLITTRWGTAGLIGGVVALVSHAIVGIP
jgi:hypothetical protein